MPTLYDVARRDNGDHGGRVRANDFASINNRLAHAASLCVTLAAADAYSITDADARAVA